MKSKIIIASLLLSFLLIPAFSEDKPDALVLYRQGRYREAVEVCLQELEEMPRRMDAYAVLGWSLLRLQDYDNVIKYSQKALTIRRNDHRIHEILAEGLYHNGRNLEALEHFQEYVNLQPTGTLIADVYYFMGEIFIRLGEFHHADIAFSTALHHNARVAKWWARLGYAREMARDYQFSLEAYEKALQLDYRLQEALRGKERVQAVM